MMSRLSGSGRRTSARIAVGVVFLASLLVPSVGALPAGAAETVAADDGARIVATRVLSPRMRDLTISSPAMGRRVKARLLLPGAYATDPQRHWPLLYLLHGCCDTYQSWTRDTDVEQLTQPTDLLVVTPEAGPAGMYSNWLNNGRYGPPRWETFHLTELRQLLERNYRASDRRAVAGLSMGGFGALSYAGRHPGFFRAAASYSGVVDTLLGGPRGLGPRVIFAILSAGTRPPQALWGTPLANTAVWRQHNPYDLAGKLRGTRLFIATGNGRPGPLDPPGTAPDELEQLLFQENVALAGRLLHLGVPFKADFYGPGTHTWPYWQRELHRSLPLLLSALAAPATARLQPAA